MEGSMISYLLLFATIAFAALAILFYVHYRKMVDLESALNRSEVKSTALKASLDSYDKKYEKIIKCFKTAQTNDEKITYITKVIGG